MAASISSNAQSSISFPARYSLSTILKFLRRETPLVPAAAINEAKNVIELSELYWCKHKRQL